MVLLLVFAVIAGAATALTPCVLPVLPALLSTSATGGRRRPLGIVLGLATTFTVTIIALASLIKGVGLADDAVRLVAVVVLAGFGLALLVPMLGHRIEARLSRISRFGPSDRGDGFWSGVAVGGALGFVYAPCAGPILGAVIAGGATSGTSAGIVAVAVAYSAGSSAVLLAYAFGSHKLGDRIRRAGRGPVLQRIVGVVMLLTAGAIATDLDVRFQTALADHFPDAIMNPTGGLERSSVVEQRLADLRGEAKFDSGNRSNGSQRARVRAGRPSDLPVLGDAPEFTGNQRWFNTPSGKALTLAGLRGRVVLIDFWTYTCINCIRTLPYVKAWDARYRDKGLTIVGVHTPEFQFERKAENVEEAIAQNRIRYPVAQDNEYATWDAYGNQYWPAKYLIDSKGQVRYTHFGEGDYRETDEAIQSLLEEARGQRLRGDTRARTQAPSPELRTPETYLGFERADRFLPRPPRPGRHAYHAYRGRLPLSHQALGGTWDVDPERATAVQAASLRLRFKARRVFAVLAPPDRGTGRVRLLLDGRPVGPGSAGPDVRTGRVTIGRQRLYGLVSLPGVEDRTLTLRLSPGTSAYAFTFG